MSNNKIVLAFSGGLDTSYCVKYLTHEKKMEVHSAVVNTGGFSEEELKNIENKAYNLGVANHQTLEQTQNYYDYIIKYLIFGNVLKNNTYPLSVSAERVYQAISLVEYAKSIGANYIAHGSTGAGNDQVRFDLIFQPPRTRNRNHYTHTRPPSLQERRNRISRKIRRKCRLEKKQNIL